jgi:hypothetical protein
MPIQLPRWTGADVPPGIAAFVNTFAGTLERIFNGGAQLGANAAPNGPAGGMLAGYYPKPSFASIAAGSLLGNNGGSAAAPSALTVAQALALLGIAQASPIKASLSSDVALNSNLVYFDGPSVAQGSAGTWVVSGTVTVVDSSGPATFSAKLWDGTTVIASCTTTSFGANNPVSLSLSGFLASPTGNLRISVIDANASPAGKIKANTSGNGKDSTIMAIRVV